MDLNKIIFLMMLCVPMFVGAQTLTFTDHEPMGNMRTQVIRQFFRLVEQESKGRIRIDHHWNGELSSSYDAYETVREGTKADNARRLFGENIPLRQYGERIVRLAEIEVVPEFLDEYLAFAKEVGETSVKVEPGVLTLFSMQEKENPYKIHILEIYADKEAYQSHLQTAHFKKYKEVTAKMVKSLKLIDTNPLAGMKQWE